MGPSLSSSTAVYDGTLGDPSAMYRNLIFGKPPEQGGTYDGVFRIHERISEFSYAAEDLSGRGKVLIYDAALPMEQITLYGALVQEAVPEVKLRITSDSWWIESARPSDEFCKEVVDLAAGFGGMTLGSSFLGARSRLTLDFNPLACSHLKGLGLGPVLELDLTHLSTPRRVHQHIGKAHPTFMFGSPCQPLRQKKQCALVWT